jgi:predicted RNase H-like HicB family nuclease
MSRIEQSISIRKRGNWYIANYKTLGIVTQGKTKEEAQKHLLNAISFQIDNKKTVLHDPPKKNENKKGRKK